MICIECVRENPGQPNDEGRAVYNGESICWRHLLRALASSVSSTQSEGER